MNNKIITIFKDLWKQKWFKPLLAIIGLSMVIGVAAISAWLVNRQYTPYSGLAEATNVQQKKEKEKKSSGNMHSMPTKSWDRLKAQVVKGLEELPTLEDKELNRVLVSGALEKQLQKRAKARNSGVNTETRYRKIKLSAAGFFGNFAALKADLTEQTRPNNSNEDWQSIKRKLILIVVSEKGKWKIFKMLDAKAEKQTPTSSASSTPAKT